MDSLGDAGYPSERSGYDAQWPPVNNCEGPMPALDSCGEGHVSGETGALEARLRWSGSRVARIPMNPHESPVGSIPSF